MGYLKAQNWSRCVACPRSWPALRKRCTRPAAPGAAAGGADRQVEVHGGASTRRRDAASAPPLGGKVVELPAVEVTEIHVFRVVLPVDIETVVKLHVKGVV